MRDCYKILLYDICDLTNLEGDSAFWIKKCEPSTSTVVTVQNQELSPAITDQNLLGGKTINGPGCWQFAVWSTWAPYIAQYAFNAARQVLEDNTTQ